MTVARSAALLALAACGRFGFDAQSDGDGSITPPEGLPMGCASPTSEIALGAGHTCLLVGDTLRCWGRNFDGELGLGDRVHRHAPDATVTGSYRFVGAGDYHTCAVSTANELFCFGQGTWGQIGVGDQTDRDVPTLAGTGFVTMAGGDDHSCATKTDGSLWCWGRNDYGEAGATPTGTILSPNRVGADTDWISSGCGDFHCCGLRSANAGSVWCWGRNNTGQLGVNDPADQAAPISNGLSGITSLAVGARHSCAIDTAGVLSCWGSGGRGQLGVGDMAGRDTPTVVATNVASVGVGRNHTCYAGTDGALACSGANDDGQLGLGTTDVGVSAFMRVGTEAWSRVRAYWDNTCAVGTSRIACWGVNTYGQLGTNDTVVRSSPTTLCN